MRRTSTSAHTLDDHVGHWLRRAHQFTSANLAKYLKAYDLTPAQLATLLRLREVEPVSQNELGRLVAMERANIHRIVARLSERGFTLAVKDSVDARKTVIRLSKRGRTIVDELEPLHWEATRETLSVLSSVEQIQLLGLLRRICNPARGSACTE